MTPDTGRRSRAVCTRAVDPRRAVILVVLALASCARPHTEADEPSPTRPVFPTVVASLDRSHPATTVTRSVDNTTAAASNGSPEPGTADGTVNETTVRATTAPTAESAETGAPSALGTNTDPAPLRDEPGASARCIDALPLAWRAAQTLMTSVYGDDIATARAIIERFDVGSAIVMTWPDGADPSQLMSLKQSVTPPLLLATDEEGGTVQRFRGLGTLPPQHEAAARLTPDAAQHMIATHGVELAALGIDVVFGPVVDVGDGGGPIGDRVFADDAETVTTYASAYVNGWRSAGILPVIKHFPGHGHASADTHHASATTPPLAALRTVDIVPFERLEDAGAGVMVGHLIVPGLTDGQPASVSRPAVTGLLRDQLGYHDALIFSDGLEMDAVTVDRSPAQAGVAALNAGVDVLVFIDHANTEPLIDSIERAVESGALSASRLNDAVGRILNAKGVDACTIDAGGR